MILCRLCHNNGASRNIYVITNIAFTLLTILYRFLCSDKEKSFWQLVYIPKKTPTDRWRQLSLNKEQLIVGSASTTLLIKFGWSNFTLCWNYEGEEEKLGPRRATLFKIVQLKLFRSSNQSCYKRFSPNFIILYLGSSSLGCQNRVCSWQWH